MGSDRSSKDVRYVSRQYISHLMPHIDGPGELSQVTTILDALGGEFCACEDVGSEMVAETCRWGFLPMGLSLPALPVLLIKSHERRYVLDFENIHVSRNLRRYARGLTISIDRHFHRTMKAIIDVHGDDWLIPQLATTFGVLHENPVKNVRFHSIEVYRGERFVAGEIGYATGSVYTSLSGFHKANGAGTVQLVALSELLFRRGFSFWDLGMEAEYKTRLGAMGVSRHDFIRKFRQAADVGFEVSLKAERFSCEDLIHDVRNRLADETPS